MTLRVVFSCYPTAFQVPAGGEVQLLKTFEAVRGLGVDAALFDPWRTRIEDYDVLHHFSFHPGGEEILRFARSRGVAIALSTILWPDSEWWLPIDELRRIADLADVLLPNSTLEARRIGRVLRQAPERFHVVVNAVDPVWGSEPDPGPFRERYAAQLHDPRFALCAGRFDFRKNQLGLVRAMRESPVALVLIGDAGDIAYRERCREEAGPRTLLLDALPAESELLRSAYAACAAFVMPGLAETPGLAALEAGATGAPLVVTQEGSARAYFGAHAIYVHPLARGELRAAVERAVSLPRSPELRQHILEQFSWPRAGRQTLEAYRHIIERPAAQRPVPGQPAFVSEGFTPSAEIVLGGAQDFQLRLGWGGMEAEDGIAGRRLLGRAAGLYLLNSGGACLALEGWSDGVALRIRLDGAVVATAELAGGPFSRVFEVAAGSREIREVRIELPRGGAEPRLLLRRIALAPCGAHSGLNAMRP